MEKLREKRVIPFTRLYFTVKNLYEDAFPKNERLPYLPMVCYGIHPNVSWRAYFDGDEFVGFAYVIEDKRLTFVFFLAVEEDKRSLGYGSQILQKIKETSPSGTCLLTIEPVFEDAENYDQRVKRLAFYQRNGYHQLSRYYHEGPEVYEILATKGNVDLRHFEKMVSRFVLGLIPIKVD